MYHPFTIADTLKITWDVLKKNFSIFVVYSIISLVVYSVINFLTTYIFVDDSIISQLINLFFQMLIQSYLALCFYKLILTVIDREYYEFEFKEIWPSLLMVFRFIVIGLYYTVLIVIFFFTNRFLGESVTLVVLLKTIELGIFIYLLIRSIFCVCFIADENSGAIESLKQSFGLTKNHFIKTLSIVLIIIAFMITSIIPLVMLIKILQPNANQNNYFFALGFYLWYVIAFPVVQVIVMVTYRRLIYSHQDVDDDVMETL